MATKSTRSTGSQITQRGVAQGNVLVDPKTGLPVDVIPDGSGVKRLAVDANITADNVTINIDDLTPDKDQVSIGDPNTGAHIRVETNGSINVNSEIAATTDNILIVGSEDGTLTGTQHAIKVNPDGSLAVNISTTTGTYKSLFNEITSVAASTLTTIQTYTVPIGKTAYLQKVEISGSNIATYTVLINNVIQDKKRTYFGDSLNEKFEFADINELGYPLVASDVITVKVIHVRSTLGDFNSRLQVIEV